MRFSISLREVKDLIISVLVLGLVFSFSNLNNFVINTLIIGVAFIVHELAHKIVAEYFDCKAEYVLWGQGVLLSLIIGLFTNGLFVFAAVGFVVINSYYSSRVGFRFFHLTLEESGKISVAGPLGNVLIGLISALFAKSNPLMSASVNLNFTLAIFNLLPFPPLDGSKVFMWSRIAWFSIIASVSIIYLLTLFINPLIAGIIGLIILISGVFYGYYKGY